MIALSVAALMLVFNVLAVRAVRRAGLVGLVLVSALALLSLVGLALALSAAYSVPSPRRVVVGTLAFLGPSIVVASVAVAMARRVTVKESGLLLTSFAATLVGLALGWVVVIYGLRVW